VRSHWEARGPARPRSGGPGISTPWKSPRKPKPRNRRRARRAFRSAWVARRGPQRGFRTAKQGFGASKAIDPGHPVSPGRSHGPSRGRGPRLRLIQPSCGRHPPAGAPLARPCHRPFSPILPRPPPASARPSHGPRLRPAARPPRAAAGPVRPGPRAAPGAPRAGPSPGRPGAGVGGRPGEGGRQLAPHSGFCISWTVARPRNPKLKFDHGLTRGAGPNSPWGPPARRRAGSNFPGGVRRFRRWAGWGGQAVAGPAAVGRAAAGRGGAARRWPCRGQSGGGHRLLGAVVVGGRLGPARGQIASNRSGLRLPATPDGPPPTRLARASLCRTPCPLPEARAASPRSRTSSHDTPVPAFPSARRALATRPASGPSVCPWHALLFPPRRSSAPPPRPTTRESSRGPPSLAMNPAPLAVPQNRTAIGIGPGTCPRSRRHAPNTVAARPPEARAFRLKGAYVGRLPGASGSGCGGRGGCCPARRCPQGFPEGVAGLGWVCSGWAAATAAAAPVAAATLAGNRCCYCCRRRPCCRPRCPWRCHCRRCRGNTAAPPLSNLRRCSGSGPGPDPALTRPRSPTSASGRVPLGPVPARGPQRPPGPRAPAAAANGSVVRPQGLSLRCGPSPP
jgi:hypothetical protein